MKTIIKLISSITIGAMAINLNCYGIVHVNKHNAKAKNIYLTFDDGPSCNVTNSILNTLKEQKVKATFFLIGYKLKDNETIVKRIDKEGHSIGLHSYSHNVRTLYSSDDNFIKEMQQEAAELKSLIGYKPKCLRFPGGSKPRLNSSLYNKLHKLHYKIFDWNKSLSDGLNYSLSPSTLYQQALNPNDSFDRIILLLHCDSTNANTCRALPSIIKYYKTLGYTFKPITQKTKEYFFKFKN